MRRRSAGITSANPVVIQRYNRSPIAEASMRISGASARVAGGIGAATPSVTA
jgi:hypothetical protein